MICHWKERPLAVVVYLFFSWNDWRAYGNTTESFSVFSAIITSSYFFFGLLANLNWDFFAGYHVGFLAFSGYYFHFLLSFEGFLFLGLLLLFIIFRKLSF
jgi:hypothetical protein